MTNEINAVQKATLFLIEKACKQETTYYEALAEHCGLPTKGNTMSMAVGQLLTQVFKWCVRKNMPCLTSLVVRKSGKFEGRHGLGFWKLIEQSPIASDLKLNFELMDDDERHAIGRYLIVKTWNHFSDLKIPSNAESLTEAMEKYGITDGSTDLAPIFKVFESIPGWETLPETRRHHLLRGQTLLNAEILHDQVIAEIEAGKSPEEAVKILLRR